MKRAIMLLAGLALAAMPCPPALAQTQGVVIVCPRNTTIGVPDHALPSGWTSQLEMGGAFLEAKVQGSPTYPVVMLLCRYKHDPPLDRYPIPGGGLGRPAPANMACTVDTGNPAQFICLPASPKKVDRPIH